MPVPEICAAKIRSKYLSACIVSPKPRAWFMCGLPGSGKSSFIRLALERGEMPQTAFLMDPDGIMENIESYQKDFTMLGPDIAFGRWEMPARSLAYEMLDEARLNKFDLVIDMGHALPESRFIVDSLRVEGYETTMYFMNCPENICRERVAKRQRYLPPELITQRAETLKENLVYFRDRLDRFVEIDGSKPQNRD